MALIDDLLGGALPTAFASVWWPWPTATHSSPRSWCACSSTRACCATHDGAWQLVGPVTERRVPGSVQAVLSARLDELAGEEKRVAQEAAVVGRIFWDVDRGAPAQPTGRRGGTGAARHCASRSWWLRACRRPWPGASEWSFHHVLVRDVAYDSLPKADRSSLHLQVARWAEIALSDRIDEFAELVASHTVAALRYEEELATGDDGP